MSPIEYQNYSIDPTNVLFIDKVNARIVIDQSVVILPTEQFKFALIVVRQIYRLSKHFFMVFITPLTMRYFVLIT